MAEKPTLYDVLLAKTRVQNGISFVSDQYGLDVTLDATYAEAIRRSVPFICDYTAMRTALDLRANLLQEGKGGLVLPDIAPVPFTDTWIEYAVKDKLPPERHSPLMAGKVGHLISRTGAGMSIMTFEQSAKNHEDVYLLPFVILVGKNDDAVGWSLDLMPVDQRATFDNSDWADFPDELADWIRAIFLTGNDRWMPKWAHRIGGVLFVPRPPKKSDKGGEFMSGEMMRAVQESGASISLLLTLLSLIAWCPVEIVKKKPTGMWLHRRKPRPYMERRTVTIQIPIRVAYKHLKKAYHDEIHRRRRHRVREHLRVYHAGKPNEKITHIKEHERGDAALGWVDQNYKVHGRRVDD